MELKEKILTYLYYLKEQSIAGLSKSLAKSTPIVTKAINELLEQKIIVDKGLAASTGGRRAALYSLNENLDNFIVSVSIDQFYTSIYLSNLQQEILAEEVDIKLDLTDPTASANILKHLRIFIESHIDAKKVIGIGISMPGFVNSTTGLNNSYTEDNPLHYLKNTLETEFNIPTVIDNDSRCVAWAEKEFGSGINSTHTLVINLNWGVGLGIIINGEIFTGATGFAGEFSHIPLSNTNSLCSCGKRGCLEVEASLKSAIDQTEMSIQQGEYSIYSTLSKTMSNKSDALIEAAKIGDQLVIYHIGKIGYMIGKGISTLLHILNPNKIIISGRGAEIGNILMPQIQNAVNEFSIPRIAKMTKIEISNLHKTAQQKGTTALVVEHYINHILTN
ncbi:MAG: ROK family protein [Sphingobacterium sp.]|jgi:predicted NBD/HSP70 family sugar kinase|uniref:ROK family protein n=1 Tax=Sphingobacterium sp. TaxID=341027 RepID=UPI00284EF9C1|nr:ROK family protein [Sphingobacterium sp.]MDR3009320.1 ROK family protein [Sphingobacterium sp.]